MNLLIIHEVSYSNKIVYEYQILAEMLAMQGHSITVIDYEHDWHTQDAPTVLRTNVRKTWRAYPEASVTVRTAGMLRVPVLSRVSSAITTTLEIWKVLRSQKIDAIVLYSLPTFGVQALILARLFKVPIFFRAMDLIHQLVSYKSLKWITKKMEGFIYRNVDGVSCVTPNIKAYVERLGRKKAVMLPSGVDLALFRPLVNQPMREPWRVRARRGIGQDGPIVLFMGTLYKFSGLYQVISEWREVQKVHPHATLLIVGSGEDEERLMRLAYDLDVDQCVVFTGPVRYKELPDIINACDLCINPFELNDITRDILPTKLFQYMACGKPVLMTRLPGTVLKELDDGVIYCNLKDFAWGIHATLSLDKAWLERLGENAAQTAAKYDWREIAEKFAGWMKVQR